MMARNNDENQYTFHDQSICHVMDPDLDGMRWSGGGGSGTATVPVAGAQGLWNNSASTSRSVTGIFLDDGTY
jgi:hypothetical protein